MPINYVKIKADYLNPFHAELSYSNFNLLEVVSRCRDPQLQVSQNYSHLFDLRSHIRES